MPSLVGSEMCIRDSSCFAETAASGLGIVPTILLPMPSLSTNPTVSLLQVLAAAALCASLLAFSSAFVLPWSHAFAYYSSSVFALSLAFPVQRIQLHWHCFRCHTTGARFNVTFNFVPHDVTRAKSTHIQFKMLLQCFGCKSHYTHTLNSITQPVSYTHLTLPTTPYV